MGQTSWRPALPELSLGLSRTDETTAPDKFAQRCRPEIFAHVPTEPANETWGSFWLRNGPETKKVYAKFSRKPLFLLVGLPGVEPGTNGL